MTSSDAQPAPLSIRRRLAARAVDLITVATWVWAMSVAHILFPVPMWSEQVQVGPWGASFLFMVSFTVLYALYEVVFVARTGSTPGKDLLRLHVVDEHTGQPPALSQAVRRALPITVIWLAPLWWLGLILTGAVGATGLADRQTLRTIADRLAGTRVAPQVEIELDDRDPQEVLAERVAQFVPRFVDPIQVLPRQIFNHPGAPRHDRSSSGER